VKERLKAEVRAQYVGPTALAQPIVAMSLLLPLASKQSVKKLEKVEFVNYEMTDTESDSNSDDESETSQKKPKKRVPEWSRRENLHKALTFQYSPNLQIDPDELFGEVETCNLEMIFNKKSSHYRRRKSSGDWTKDRVTSEEKRAYKLAVL
jgi:hypothetical protein